MVTQTTEFNANNWQLFGDSVVNFQRLKVFIWLAVKLTEDVFRRISHSILNWQYNDLVVRPVLKAWWDGQGWMWPDEVLGLAPSCLDWLDETHQWQPKNSNTANNKHSAVSFYAHNSSSERKENDTENWRKSKCNFIQWRILNSRQLWFEVAFYLPQPCLCLELPCLASAPEIVLFLCINF